MKFECDLPVTISNFVKVGISLGRAFTGQILNDKKTNKLSRGQAKSSVVKSLIAENQAKICTNNCRKIIGPWYSW